MLQNNYIQQNIHFFFEDPHVYHPPPGDYSVLYLLRRDIHTCLGFNPNTRNSIDENRALWPGTMAIMAGIDLLAKFYAGNDNRGQVSQRFRDYVRTYFQNISQRDADTIYQLRNSLLHSFGLYSTDNQGNEYNFILVPSIENCIQYCENDIYVIGIHDLHNQFENSIENFYNDLQTNADLQLHFNNMFQRYGIVHFF